MLVGTFGDVSGDCCLVRVLIVCVEGYVFKKNKEKRTQTSRAPSFLVALFYFYFHLPQAMADRL